MKRAAFFLLGSALFTSCATNGPLDQVVSQTFVHKYGFETSEEEWDARDREGQVVTTLKNGVKISKSYENGKLHGLTTHTFPHSSTIEKCLVYHQGALLKESVNDPAGIPIREEAHGFDNHTLITLWDERGVPLSVEDYEGDILMEGKYYTPEHELEAAVERGSGARTKRDRTGLLISRDEIENGALVSRTTYHPNGAIQMISHYADFQLHGTQLKYTASGKPLMETNWDQGVLHGLKIIYRNGNKVATIPYVKGKKEGTEFHYDDLGSLIAEIDWKEDQKHGATRLHSEETTDTEWFFKGQSVNAEKFKTLQTRQQILTELQDNQVR